MKTTDTAGTLNWRWPGGAEFTDVLTLGEVAACVNALVRQWPAKSRPPAIRHLLCKLGRLEEFGLLVGDYELAWLLENAA